MGRPSAVAVEFLSTTSSAETGRYRPCIREGLAYGVEFSAKMDRSPRELGEGLKEDYDEGMDVLCGFFSGLYIFARETNFGATRLFSISDMNGWLCNVRERVLSQLYGFQVVPLDETSFNVVARSKFYEKAHRTGLGSITALTLELNGLPPLIHICDTA